MDSSRRILATCARFTSGRTAPDDFGNKEFGRPTDTPPVPTTLDWNLWLGPDSRTTLPSSLRPGRMARLVGFRNRGAWRYGLPYHRSSDLGTEPRRPLFRRKSFHIGRHVVGQEPDQFRNVSSCFDHLFRISCARRVASGSDDLVRRRTDAAGAGRTAAGQRLPDNGVLYVGSKGKDVSRVTWRNAATSAWLTAGTSKDRAKRRWTVRPAITRNGFKACKTGKQPVASFDYSGPMTETVLLGVLSLRAPGTRLEWDHENQKVKNAPELNQYVHTEYRKGWTL